MSINLDISLLREEMCGSRWLLIRNMFRAFIKSVMCSGSGWFIFLILPLGMWCLSARSMRFVRHLFAECTLSGVGTSWSLSSISSVNLLQLVFIVVRERLVTWSKSEIIFGVDGDDDRQVI